MPFIFDCLVITLSQFLVLTIFLMRYCKAHSKWVEEAEGEEFGTKM